MRVKQKKRNSARDIFALARTGGDGNRVTAYARLRGMTPDERRELRRSIEWLDEVLDQVTLDLHLERRAARPQRRRESYAN